ncbi:hypothetical protein H4582DRAFT_2074392 [Lactarius indigo]|nr:hypothetical protein H4582DRAFT_2074392 [Lactarius indigo]
MPQLKTLDLHSASPVAPPGPLLPSGVERIITLPSLAHLNITSVSARDFLQPGRQRTYKKSSHMLLDTPTDLRILNLYRV